MDLEGRAARRCRAVFNRAAFKPRSANDAEGDLAIMGSNKSCLFCGTNARRRLQMIAKHLQG